MTLDTRRLIEAVPRWSAAVRAAAPELNELDGRLGDADLGATLQKCATNVDSATLPSAGTPGDVFRSLAQACAKASGSSFGTLLTLGLMTAAKRSGERPTLDRSATVELIGEVVSTLSSRGGAGLGDKTVLDGLEAIRRALDAAPDGAEWRPIAREAVRASLDAFRDRPNRIGRARMFADRTVGLDDPGMVALQRMVDAL